MTTQYNCPAGYLRAATALVELGVPVFQGGEVEHSQIFTPPVPRRRLTQSSGAVFQDSPRCLQSGPRTSTATSPRLHSLLLRTALVPSRRTLL